MSGTLYIVGTPIGNLGDLSPRAVETLASVDFIAAEDTRVTLKLLNHFEIKKPMTSYFEHNRREKGEQILARLQGGESCALVTDAGMPAISDPGEDLVKLCHDGGVPVAVVPGPTAFASALALSGMPSGRFTFEGFLSMNKQSRRAHLQSLENQPRTMRFYEAPHKLKATLADLREAFGGEREIALVRELTKIHEEVLRLTLQQACDYYETTQPKGEFVLVVAGKPEAGERDFTLTKAQSLAAQYVAGGLAPSAAAKKAAQESGFKKAEIYKALLTEEETDG
jgi:16S rRNA (cytidine1402-2'-O)-methyltransferase